MATAITPIAFFETVMVKSYETLVDSDTKVDVNTGMRRGGSAAVADRFQGLQPGPVADEGPDWTRICEAVKSTVPQEMWGEIIEKLEELEQHSEALDVGDGRLR